MQWLRVLPSTSALITMSPGIIPSIPTQFYQGLVVFGKSPNQGLCKKLSWKPDRADILSLFEGHPPTDPHHWLQLHVLPAIAYYCKYRASEGDRGLDLQDFSRLIQKLVSFNRIRINLDHCHLLITIFFAKGCQWYSLTWHVFLIKRASSLSMTLKLPSHSS